MKMVRLFKEAYDQGALLTHSDAAFLLNVSTGTVSKQMKEYMERTGEIVLLVELSMILEER